MREGTAVVISALVLACVLTYPYALKLTHAGRLDTNDGRWSVWVVAWVAHALTTDPINVYRANIFYPHQNALAFSEGNLVAGAIAAPIWVLTKNPYTTHNALFILSFAISAVGAYYLVRRLTASRHAAAVAGVLFAYCPFVFARTAHIQLLLIGFLPWCMLSFHRLLERPTALRAIELGVILWLTGLACAYYGIFAGGMVGLGSIYFAVTQNRWRDIRYWLLIGLAAIVCVGLTAPAFLPYFDLQRESGFARTLDESRTYSANLAAWFASAAWAHRWWLPFLRRPYLPDFSEVLFPGIITLALGLYGAWIGMRGSGKVPKDVVRFYVIVGVLAFWTTLGPVAGLYTLLHNTIPVLSFLRAPSRTGIVVTLCLVVLASVVIARWTEGRRGRMAFAVLFVLAIADLVQAPLGMRDARPLPGAYSTLATLPRGPVAEFPFWYTRLEFPRHAEYMLTSTAHWQHLINGYSDHIPQDFRDIVGPLSSFPSRESFPILERLNARYAVFHTNLMDQRTISELTTRIEVDYKDYLRPLHKESDVWLYEIVDWPR